jgi:hypothetical protein
MTILFVLNVCTFVMTIMQIESPYDNGLPSNFPEKNQAPFCYLWPRSQAGEKKYKLPSLDSPAWIAVAKFLLSEREAKKRSSAKAFASYFGMKDVGSINKALKKYQNNLKQNEVIGAGGAGSSDGALLPHQRPPGPCSHALVSPSY